MPTVGLGWLRGTVRADPDGIADALSPFFGPLHPRQGGTRWYRQSGTMADRRVVVAWDGLGAASGTVMVDVTQKALDGLGFDRSLALLRALLPLGFRPSRLDVWLDDRQGHADPTDVLAALEAGDVVTHAQGHEWRSNSYGGATVYVGSRESERFLRAYRTGPTHGYPGTRWELESKGDAARTAYAILAASRDALTDATRLLLGFVDFRARAGQQHGSRAPRLAWWASLVGSLDRVRMAAAVRIDSVAHRAAWLARQVAPSLAAVWTAYGDGWLNGLLSDGMDRRGGLTWASG